MRVRDVAAPALLIVLAATAYGQTPMRRPMPPKLNAAKPRDPKLAAELQQRVKVDQDARNGLLKLTKAAGSMELGKLKPEQMAVMKRIETVDHDNTEWLKGVVNRVGWPGKRLVGDKGGHDAWLLVQHADKDRPFQKRCLALMEKMLGSGEVSKVDYAYLLDRVLVADKKPQRYGTQIATTKGEMKPLPCEDPPNLDKRRAAIGLMPMAKYMEFVREMYVGKK